MSEKRNDPIDLAQADDFRLGGLDVSPSTREVRRGDWRESLEPRVMQVLVALQQAEGRVVSRDELIDRCWEGRVVGEDAINRAIGRLRRLSQADSGASFTVETIARVGYRLLAAAGPASPALPGVSAAPSSQTRPDRRLMLAAGGVAALGAAGAGFFLLRGPAQPPTISPRIAAMLEEAKQVQRAGSPETTAQAIGILENVVKAAPELADGWGSLARSYAIATHGNPAGSAAMKLRAEAAIAQALQRDPQNAMAFTARALLFPFRGHWLEREMVFRQGLGFHPDSGELLVARVDFLAAVGRNSEAARATAQAAAMATLPDPLLAYQEIITYWSAGQLAQADDAATRGMALFPRNRVVWNTRLILLLYTGRLDQALAAVADTQSRPPGTPQEDFDCDKAAAIALKSRQPQGIDAAMTAYLALMKNGAGYAESMLGFAASVDRLDEAFAVAEAMYFGRGDIVLGSARFAPVQGDYTQFDDRRTRPLFSPPCKAMRRDRRFAALMDELELTKFWRDSGVKPDYQRIKDS